MTTPIFARLLTTSEYGEVSTFNSWYSLLTILFTLCLNYSIGRAKLDYPNHLDEFIGSVQILSAIISGIIAAIALLFIQPVSHILDLSPFLVCLLVIYLFFTPTITFYHDAYRYRYEYKKNIGVAWYTVLSTTVLSLVLILLIKGNKALLRCIGITVPSVILSLYFWYLSKKEQILNYNREFWTYGLKLSLPLVAHSISGTVLIQSDRIFIRKLWSASDVAIYTLAYNYGSLISMIMVAVADAWVPWFHDNYNDGKNSQIRDKVKPIVILSCYLALGSIALAPEAVLILGGEKYMGGLNCVPPIVLGVLSQQIYTHYVNIEMHLKKTKYISVGTIFAAVLNLALNAVFVPKYGFAAAAYTTLFSYAALLFIHFLITRLILKVKLYDDVFMFGIALISGALSIILVYLYNHSLIRYVVTMAGFLSMIWVFRSTAFSLIRRTHGGNV